MYILENESIEVSCLLDRGLRWKREVLLLVFAVDWVFVTEDEVHLSRDK